MATTNAQPVLGPQSIVPNVRKSGAATTKSLDETGRERLARVLTHPIEFNQDPCFGKNDVARELFGEFADRLVSTAPWCNASRRQADVGCAPTRGVTLTTEQERRLFLRLNYARFRMGQIVSERAGKPLTIMQVRELLNWSLQADLAKAEIVRTNVPLVLAMAKRTRLTGIDYAELISEGNMALLRSVDKFDCARGFKFSTYACRAILKSFSRVAMRTSRYRGQFPTEFDPTLERSDFIEQQRVAHEVQCVDELRGILRSNRADLNEIEATVIKARFAIERIPGLEGEGPKTLEQVGMLIGVTKERVRQIQNRALAKLRSALQDDFLAA